MGRARVGVPPGERRLRAAHVERVGAAAAGAGGGVIAGNAGWGRGLQTGGAPPAESSVDDGTIFPQPARGSRVVEKYLEHAPLQQRRAGLQRYSFHTSIPGKWTVLAEPTFQGFVELLQGLAVSKTPPGTLPPPC